MKNTKRKFIMYSFFDYTSIALHLSKMAEKGWLIEKISNFGWTYRWIAPKNLEFFVSYYPKASEFNPEPTEEQKIFHVFADTQVGNLLLWHSKAKKAAMLGEFIKSFGHSLFQRIVAAVVLVGFAYYITTLIMCGPALQRTVGVVMIFYTIALISLANGVKQFLKNMQVPGSFNRVITFTVIVLLSFAMTGGITFGIFRASQNGLFEDLPQAPVTIEDLLGAEYDGYTGKWRSSESLLLGSFVMQQHPESNTGYSTQKLNMYYTITEVKLPFLYKFCKNSLLNSSKDEVVDGQVVFYEHNEPIDPIPWQAEEAYKLYWSDGHFIDRYLLCYEKRIIVITFSWEPTAEQMAIIEQSLSVCKSFH